MEYYKVSLGNLVMKVMVKGTNVLNNKMRKLFLCYLSHIHAVLYLKSFVPFSDFAFIISCILFEKIDIFLCKVMGFIFLPSTTRGMPSRMPSSTALVTS